MAMVSDGIVVRGEHLSDKDVGDFLVVKDHWSGDGSSASTIGTELSGLSGSVRAEVVRAIAAEAVNAGLISAEATTARAAESANATAIAAEATTARAAEVANANAISAEQVRAAAAEAANEVHIDKMATLSGMAKDSEHLGSFSGATITDNKDIKTAMQEIETALESEVATRLADDNALGVAMAANTAAIAAEATTARAAEVANANAITAEAATARAAEVANANAITAEAVTARAAEGALGDRLDDALSGADAEGFSLLRFEDQGTGLDMHLKLFNGELVLAAV